MRREQVQDSFPDPKTFFPHKSLRCFLEISRGAPEISEMIYQQDKKSRCARAHKPQELWEGGNAGRAGLAPEVLGNVLHRGISCLKSQDQHVTMSLKKLKIKFCLLLGQVSFSLQPGVVNISVEKRLEQRTPKQRKSHSAVVELGAGHIQGSLFTHSTKHLLITLVY